MTPAWIGLGANLGDPPATLSASLQLLEQSPRVRLRAVSPAYWSAPWGKTDQPEFLNAVARLDTPMPARELLDELLSIETRLGRKRDGETWGPRLIDLDLLIFGDAIIRQPDLIVPHPYLDRRAFVLVPLADLAPQLVVPGLGRIDQLLAALEDGIRDSLQPAAFSFPRTPQCKTPQS